LIKARPVLENFFDTDITKENIKEVFEILTNIRRNPDLIKHITRYATKKTGIYKLDLKDELFNCGMELEGAQYLRGSAV
jgi:hypothetical protein